MVVKTLIVLLTVAKFTTSFFRGEEIQNWGLVADIPMFKMNSTMEEMLSETSETAVPKFVTDFLEVHFHLKKYEAAKQLYLSLMAIKKDDFLTHLEKSYTLVNFWKNMYLGVITKLDKPLEQIKTERESIIKKNSGKYQ